MAKKKSRAKKKVSKEKKITNPDPVRTPLPKKSAETKPRETKPDQPKIRPYPEAGKKVTDFEAVLDRQLAGEPAPAPKRGPGRPPTKKPEPEPPQLSIDVVAGVVKIPFELWSISQSVPALALSDDEAKTIAEPAMQLLEYYLPQIPVIAYAWVSVSVSTFWVMQSRLRTIQEIKLHRARIAKSGPVSTEPAQPGVETTFPSETKTKKV